MLVFLISCFRWISVTKKQKRVYWLRRLIPNPMVLSSKRPCGDRVAPRLSQPFILPRLIKSVPGISRNWVIKSELLTCSGSVDFRHLNLKGGIKLFFEENTRNITLAAIKTIWMFRKFEFWAIKFFFEEDTRNITLAAIKTIWMFLKFEFWAIKFFFEEDTRNITLAAIKTIWMFLIVKF